MFLLLHLFPEAATSYIRLIPFRRLFTDTQVWTGSSSSAAAAGHNPEDLTPSHIRSDLDALHRRVQHIEEEDVRADNKRLKMMLDSSENRTKMLGERRPATCHYINLDVGLLSRDAAKLAPANDTEEAPYPEETSPSERKDSTSGPVAAAEEAERQRQVNARRQGNNEAGGQGGAPAARECTFSGFMKCNPTVFHGHEGAVELSRWFEKRKMVFGIMNVTEARKSNCCCLWKQLQGVP
ncbi:hypothetical protein Tco_0700600 [Tanacetum coccineum]